MRSNDLDLGTMTRLLGRLAAAHGKPFGAALDRQAEEYRKALAEFAVEEVERAVDTACRDFERFPKPKHLRMIALAARPIRTGTHSGTDDLDRCPGCNTRYQWRRLPHWNQGPPPAEDLQCDCAWKRIVRAYATDDDLDTMSHRDPFAAAELRRRAAIKAAA